MKVTIEVAAGPDNSDAYKDDVQKNIDALQRAVDGEPQARDFILLLDTISIMRAIQARLRSR